MDEFLSAFGIFFAFLGWVLFLVFGAKFTLDFFWKEDLEGWNQRAKDLFLDSDIGRSEVGDELGAFGRFSLLRFREPGTIYFLDSSCTFEETEARLRKNIDFISGQGLTLGVDEVFVGEELGGGIFKIERTQSGFSRGWLILAHGLVKVSRSSESESGSRVEIAVLSRGRRNFIVFAVCMAGWSITEGQVIDALVFFSLFVGPHYLIAWFKKLNILWMLRLFLKSSTSH